MHFPYRPVNFTLAGSFFFDAQYVCAVLLHERGRCTKLRQNDAQCSVDNVGKFRKKPRTTCSGYLARNFPTLSTEHWSSFCRSFMQTRRHRATLSTNSQRFRLLGHSIHITMTTGNKISKDFNMLRNLCLRNQNFFTFYTKES